jgi:hypothetical protein
MRAAAPIEPLEPRRLLAFEAPFLVNTFTTLGQVNPAIDMQPDGSFVVAWESNSQEGPVSGYGIYAQRFSAAGVKIGTELQVSTHTTGNQRNPSVAVDDNGNFVIAWQGVAQPAPGDTDNYGIYARRYTVSGETVTPGAVFVVNTAFTGIQREPAVAMDADGDFVIVFRSPDGGNDGIFARRYDNTGAPIDAEPIAVNTVTANNQINAAVAMDVDGDFVVTWQSYNQAGAATSFDVYARRHTAGNWEGAEQLVNLETADLQEVPSIAMNPGGAYVIAWSSNLQDGSQRGIYARRFSNTGTALVDPFLVNVHTTNQQRHPTVGMAADGQFVVTWASNLQDGSLYGIYARRYNAAGAALDALDAAVNTYTSGNQTFPTVAMDADGDFVVTWTSSADPSFDNSSYGVYARRFIADTTGGGDAPEVTSGQFIWENAPQRLEFVFDLDVSASLDDGDLVLQNLTTATPIDPQLIQREWFAGTKTLRYTFPTLLNGGALPNGHYRATLVASGINAGGPAMGQNFELPFFFVNGDADHNGNVDVNDLGILATNWQQPSSQQYGLGDFDYSGTVEVNDLGIVATSWQFSLGPPPAPAARPGKTLASTRAEASDAAAIVDSTRRAPARR